MPQLFLVRHAEPQLTGTFLGHVDSPLSDAGRAHAQTLLENVSLSIVYTSPLLRALQTAEILARGAKIEIIDDLRDITFGRWDGRTWADVYVMPLSLKRARIEAGLAFTQRSRSISCNPSTLIRSTCWMRRS